MPDDTRPAALDRLEPFIGTWSIEARFPNQPELEVDATGASVTFEWALTREQADFSPLDFSQRFLGTFSDDGSMIRGAWEMCNDGETWEMDLEIDYTRRA